MCIAILSPQDVVVPYDHLQESFDSNPDGAGFMYAENDQLIIEKGFMDFDSFYQAYAPHQEKACAIHFRIKTHGKVNPDNTHPFQVGKHMGVIHNGIINNVDTRDAPEMSDTYHFNEKFLAPIYRKDSRFAYKEHFKDLIKSYIGYSKLVFLNNKGHYSIVNESAGHWDNGVWYSNKSYVKYTPTHFTPQKKNAIVPADDENPPSVFRIGCRVRITTNNTPLFGTLAYFTGGLMAGVQIDNAKNTSLIALADLELAPVIPPTNPFKIDDWVCRVDNSDNRIGVVTGTSKNLVWVQWMSDSFNDIDPKTYVLNSEKLQHYDFYGDI